MPTRRRFLSAGLALGISAIVAPASAFGTEGSGLRVGAGRAEVIFPPKLFPLDGFVGQHDPLAVRVLVLDDGAVRLGIVVVDITSLSADVVTAIKAVLLDVAAVSPGNGLVCASHTFSAPHVFPSGHTPPNTDARANAATLQAFLAATREASARAVAAMQPGRIGFGLGTSPVNVNRDVETPHGWWLGANPAGYADHALGVVRIDGLDGRPLAVLMNFAVQSSIMDGSQLATGGKLISADLAGAAARHVEGHYGHDAVAFFLVGAAGDQAPAVQANRHTVAPDGTAGRVDIHEQGFDWVARLGGQLGGEAVRVADAIRTDGMPSLGIRRETATTAALVFSPHNAPTGPVTAFAYTPGPKIALPVALMRIGDIAIVGVQPELAASLGSRIKTASPYAHTLVATMVDGGAKYMPDAQSYDRFTYEARNSPFARGAGEDAASAIVGMLNTMKDAEK